MLRKAQTTERERKQPAAQLRKSEFAAKIAEKECPRTASHPAKKRGLIVKGTVANFPNDGFHIVSGVEARHSCNQQLVSGENKDLASVQKRATQTKKRIGHIMQRKLSQLKDARLPSAEPAAEPGVARMEPDGTRNSSASAEDTAFRFRVTRAMIAAGIPLSTMTVIRPALEGVRQRPLAFPKALASERAGQVLSREADLQLEELKGKQTSAHFDAAPRVGDALALFVRCVETTEEGA